MDHDASTPKRTIFHQELLTIPRHTLPSPRTPSASSVPHTPGPGGRAVHRAAFGVGVERAEVGGALGVVMSFALVPIFFAWFHAEPILFGYETGPRGRTSSRAIPALIHSLPSWSVPLSTPRTAWLMAPAHDADAHEPRGSGAARACRRRQLASEWWA
ncbi:hypothetical protein C0993_012501 [Termitomyces sp. T159_Od127]|nr:hypothetical protein C0993_012501 [Termitomyces sp. T159_Od127]